jgi:6-phosphogluconate dehydrogenase
MKTQQGQYKIGIIGLGVMGRNILLNISEKGFLVAGYDTDPSKVKGLYKEKTSENIFCTVDPEKFIESLSTPRTIMILVPAGPPVDTVINVFQPLLHDGDIIIDAGNSYFKDTILRSQKIEKEGILYLGTGISGGKEGARHGPSIMPGGNKEAYEKVRTVFEAIAAHINGQPCVEYIGSGGSGHYVKMVHNGIEYAIMQLISETYDLMKRGLYLSNSEIQETFNEWNQGDINSYLLEITAQIFKKTDIKTGKFIIDDILDVARQNDTGMWTSESAMEIHVPAPTIDTAVSMRNLSGYSKDRATASKILLKAKSPFTGEKKIFLYQLQNALYTAMIMTYAQGFSILLKASETYQFHLDPGKVARIWSGGCIIRSVILDEIMKAFSNNHHLTNLLLDPELSKKINEKEKYLRQVISQAIISGIPVPAFMSVLAYFDSLRSIWLPANLIQAQRDYFGDHQYERYDSPGLFHTKW